MNTDYETVCILRPDAGEAGVKDVIQKATAALEATGGSVKDIQERGRKRLAYPIQKKNEGYYIVFAFSGAQAALKELDKYLRFNEDVIRYQTVRHEAREAAVTGEVSVEKTGAAEKTAPAAEKAAPVAEKTAPAAEKAAPAAEKTAPAAEKTEPAAEKTEPAVEKTEPAVEKTDAPVEKAQENKGGEDA